MKGQREGGFLISRVHQLAGRIFNRMLRENDVEINRAQGRIMFVLWKEDEIPIRELTKKTSLQKSTLTTLLDRLEGSGFIRRVPSRKDRREILIRRTGKDLDHQDLYVRISEEMNRLFYKGFQGREIDEFEGYLKRILGNLRDFEGTSS